MTAFLNSFIISILKCHRISWFNIFIPLTWLTRTKSYSTVLYSLIFHSIPFYFFCFYIVLPSSVLFCSILFCSVLFNAFSSYLWYLCPISSFLLSLFYFIHILEPLQHPAVTLMTASMNTQTQMSQTKRVPRSQSHPTYHLNHTMKRALKGCIVEPQIKPPTPVHHTMMRSPKECIVGPQIKSPTPIQGIR